MKDLTELNRCAIAAAVMLTIRELSESAGEHPPVNVPERPLLEACMRFCRKSDPQFRAEYRMAVMNDMEDLHGGGDLAGLHFQIPGLYFDPRLKRIKEGASLRAATKSSRPSPSRSPLAIP